MAAAIGRTFILNQAAQIGLSEADVNALSPADKIGLLRAVASAMYSANLPYAEQRDLFTKQSALVTAQIALAPITELATKVQTVFSMMGAAANANIFKNADGTYKAVLQWPTVSLPQIIQGPVAITDTSPAATP